MNAIAVIGFILVVVCGLLALIVAESRRRARAARAGDRKSVV